VVRHIIFISLFCLFWSLSGQAQRKSPPRRDYINGYIINSYGDTLLGKIKLTQQFKGAVRIIPESDTLERVQRIGLDEIKEVHLNIMLFEKVTYKGKERLFEKVANGYYNLFAFTYLGAEIPENRYLLKLEKEVLEITEGNFMKMAERFLFDNTELREKIFSRKAGFPQVIDLFRQYNLWKVKEKTN
jgi:hypothetical protein